MAGQKIVVIGAGVGGMACAIDLAGAGFDVLTVEPPRNGHPLLDVHRPNFILTPHIAWASDGAMQFLADQLIDNIDSWAAGNPQHLVT